MHQFQELLCLWSARFLAQKYLYPQTNFKQKQRGIIPPSYEIIIRVRKKIQKLLKTVLIFISSLLDLEQLLNGTSLSSFHQALGTLLSLQMEQVQLSLDQLKRYAFPDSYSKQDMRIFTQAYGLDLH